MSRKSSISVQSESPSLPTTSLSQPQPVQNARPVVAKATAITSKSKEVSNKEVNVMESMTRSKKDLHRSAVALSRFHTVHEEVWHLSRVWHNSYICRKGHLRVIKFANIAFVNIPMLQHSSSKGRSDLQKIADLISCLHGGVE